MINTKRLLLAYVLALLVGAGYESLVYGFVLHNFHAQYSTWLKPQDQLPLVRMILSSALNVALITVFYALFARGGAARLSTGVLFGVFLGLIAGWMQQLMSHMVMREYPFYLAWGPANFGYFLVLGVVLGLVYKDKS